MVHALQPGGSTSRCQLWTAWALGKVSGSPRYGKGDVAGWLAVNVAILMRSSLKGFPLRLYQVISTMTIITINWVVYGCIIFLLNMLSPLYMLYQCLICLAPTINWQSNHPAIDLSQSLIWRRFLRRSRIPRVSTAHRSHWLQRQLSGDGDWVAESGAWIVMGNPQ